MFREDIDSNLHLSKLSGKMLLNGIINEERCSLKTDLTCVSSILYQNLQKKIFRLSFKKTDFLFEQNQLIMNKRID